MTEQPTPAADLAEIEAFLIHEARLLDDRSRWPEWLDLYTEDAIYWVPYTAAQTDPELEPSIIYEDRVLLEVRLTRMGEDRAWSQQPGSRTARIVGNVALDGNDPETGDTVVRSTFHMFEYRRDAYQPYAGHMTHHLTRTDDGWRIRRKRVDLISEDGVYEHIIEIPF